ncbi:alpha/beta hydrolase fold domain-containing protein [Hirsutella rhossiliensis]
MNEKFYGFNRRDLVYSCINGHELLATVLTPRMLENQPSSQRPILVHWHGGGFIARDRMYGPWWPKWSLELALSQNAIVISPDYRLAPEASGSEILADVAAFCNWMHNELPLIARRDSWVVYPDITRVASLGESAGGYLAIQLAILSPKKGLRAVICISAPLHHESNLKHSIPQPRIILGTRPPPPRQAEALIRGYMRSSTPGSIRSQGDPTEMWQLVLSIAQQAWLPRLLGLASNERLNLTLMLDELECMPPLWIIHSVQDSVVPVECSTEFVKAVEEKYPNLPVLLSLEQGDHGFDSSLGMAEHWIQEGCRFIRQFWP